MASREFFTTKNITVHNINKEMNTDTLLKYKSIPSDVIVHDQIRDVFRLRSSAMGYLQESVDFLWNLHKVLSECFMSFYHRQVKAKETFIRENVMSNETYVSEIMELQEEQRAHAAAKISLMEVSDRLSVTSGDFDSVRQQMNEHVNFYQHIVENLKTQLLKANQWNAQLEQKYTKCEKQCQEFEGHLEAKDGSIKDLERRLAEMQGRFQHALCDVNIQRQQDHYISCMNERKPSKMYSCRKSLRKV